MKIVKASSLILTKKAKPVAIFDKKLKKLVNQMIKTLSLAKNPEGVGLAAPQVNILKRIFIMQTNPETASIAPNSKKSKTSYKIIINPKIIDIANKKVESSASVSENRRQAALSEKKPVLEGCLSLNNIWGYPKRQAKIRISYQDISGKKHTQIFTGFPAQIVQHEIDHLNGILFTRRVLKQKKQLYKIKKDKKTKENKLISLDL